MYHWPSEAELKTAAQLAQEGYLSTVKFMKVQKKNISEISSDNIGKLVSIVSDEVYIVNGTPVSLLDTIMASVQAKKLYLRNVSLSEENTRALVTAMRARVQVVELWKVTLDPELLSSYDGKGHCSKLEFGDTLVRYRVRLKRWAGDRRWKVTRDDEILRIERQ